MTATPTAQGPVQTPSNAEGNTPRTAKGSGLFRAFWRWHFYASFLVIPVLLVLASTGLVYLLRFQIEPAVHADLMKVHVPSNAQRLSYDDQQAAVLKAFPRGHVSAVTEPSAPNRSTDFSVSSAPAGTPSWADDTIREVYVNPYTGDVLGRLNPDHTISGMAKNIHQDMWLGKKGQYVMEVGASWAIVMAITGYYLYFKGRGARAKRKAKMLAGAALRHRHATIGLFVGVGLVGLVATGLPWTVWWGAHVQTLATNHGTSLWSNDPGAQSAAPTMDMSVPHSHAVPWGEGKSPVPTSTTTTKTHPIGLDAAIAVGSAQGLKHPFTIAMPGDKTGVYSVMGYAFNDPTREETVHVDQYAPKVDAKYGYGNYTLLAKVVDQGIALHEGRRLGVVNFWASALFCVAVIFMCLSAPFMWWRRRPKASRSIGAPLGRLNLKTGPIAVACLVALALFLPTFGVTLVAVVVLDQIIIRNIRPLRAFFNVA